MNLFRRDPGLDAPLAASSRAVRPAKPGRERSGASTNERFGRWTESIARGMGTPWFLLLLTVFCVAWLAWNTFGHKEWRFDSAALGFTALTLILSLQASYAAPMILLAQNRQDDRDRVQIEQDRQRAERNLADTEFLAREVVALRLALKELPDRDFVRQELRALLAELETPAEDDSDPDSPSPDASDRNPQTPSASDREAPASDAGQGVDAEPEQA